VTTPDGRARPTAARDAITLATSLRSRVEQIEPPHADGDEFLGPDRAAELDPLPLVIDISALKITGYSADDEASAGQVPVTQAVGRVAAEMLTPYPPGIPAAIPGERLNAPVLDYLRSGVDAGMVVPDVADPKLGSVRVLIEG